MRRRVLRALRAAADDAPSERPHERTAFDLARAVIARDRELDWQVLAQPQRLRIDTLDAFNAWLARQLPVLADGVAAADVVDKPDDLHREAARRCVAGVAGDEEPLRSSLLMLLRDVGNDCEQLEGLLAALLPRRDQWLRLLAGDTEPLRPLLEGALQRLVDDELAATAALCDEALARAIGAAVAARRRRSQRRVARSSRALARARASAVIWAASARRVARRRGVAADEAGRVAQAPDQDGRLRPAACAAPRQSARSARGAAGSGAAARRTGKPSARCPTRATRKRSGAASRRCKSCSSASRPSSRWSSRSGAPSTSSSSRSQRSARSATSTRRRSCCSRSIAASSICSSTSSRTRRSRSAGCWSS